MGSWCIGALVKESSCQSIVVPDIPSSCVSNDGAKLSSEKFGDDGKGEDEVDGNGDDEMDGKDEEVIGECGDNNGASQVDVAVRRASTTCLSSPSSIPR
jgi:hypothetical protein